MRDEPIPYGYCQCGCGDVTPILLRSRSSHGEVKGEPRRYLPGHGHRANWTSAFDVLDETGAMRIPLRSRDGTIQAFALVDATDYLDVAAHPWHRGNNGYAMRRIPASEGKRLVLLHRVLLGLPPIEQDSREGDHINRDKLDCRRSNLRIVTGAQNKQNRSPSGNRTARGVPTSSQYRGVTLHKHSGLWFASVRVDGTVRWSAYFRDEDEAGRAAAAARLRLMPYTVEAVA